METDIVKLRIYLRKLMGNLDNPPDIPDELMPVFALQALQKLEKYWHYEKPPNKACSRTWGWS